MERRAYRVTGRVQGVGFRSFARFRAMDLSLKGWVCNRMDGSVEIQVEGPRAKLDAYEGLLKQGPPSGHVELLERIEADSREGFKDFEIRFG